MFQFHRSNLATIFKPDSTTALRVAAQKYQSQYRTARTVEEVTPMISFLEEGQAGGGCCCEDNKQLVRTTTLLSPHMPYGLVVSHTVNNACHKTRSMTHLAGIPL